MADLAELLSDVQQKKQAKADASARMAQAAEARDAAQQYIWRQLEVDVQKMRDAAAQTLANAQQAFDAAFTIASQASQALDDAKRALTQAVMQVGVGTGNEL